MSIALQMALNNQQVKALKVGRPAELVACFTWERTLEYFHHRCAFCQCKPPDGLTIDHFIPLCSPRSPGHTVYNLVPACKRCNNDKAGQEPAIWLVKRFGRGQTALNVLVRIEMYFVSLQLGLLIANGRKRTLRPPSHRVFLWNQHKKGQNPT